MQKSIHVPLFAPVIIIWILNCILAIGIAIREVWIPTMSASWDPYTTIKSDQFDGTVMPIAFIPNWLNPENQDKSKHYTDIPIREFIPLPKYDRDQLMDQSWTQNDTIIARYTYIGVYMGSYRLNYQENDGGHLAIDIRAPIGTPVLSIANGVVVRTLEWDATGNKFIVVRHDGVPYNGKIISLYSAYEHLSEITISEGSKVKKWDMIGRVGLTGITTTPHLHFQIDLAEAPFHPYWPFSSSDLTVAKMDFLTAINAGIGRENALKYTIHPLDFVQAHLWWIEKTSIPHSNTRNNTSDEGDTPIIAWSIEQVQKSCEKKRFSDVDWESILGKRLYKLSDAHCLFQDRDTFNGRERITRREGLMLIMDSLSLKILVSTSDFLDVPLNDPLQWYLARAKQLGAIDGITFHPDETMTKAEFIDWVVKLMKLEHTNSTLLLYPDVDEKHPYFNSIQQYSSFIQTRRGRFFPDITITRSIAIDIMAEVLEIK